MDYATDLQAVKDLLANNKQALVYKHSTQCPISAQAHKEVQAFLDEHDVPYAAVRVIEERPISDAIEQQTGVTHESPQAIIIKNGAVAWHESHTDVTKEALKAAWNSAKNS